MSLARKTIAACALLLAASLAHAAPVQFKYTSTAGTFANTPGVNPGDLVTITLLADNGNTSINGQSWRISDILSGSLSAGSYWQSYTDGWFSDPSWLAFTTDASGALTLSKFYGTTYSANHQDSFGTGGNVYLYNGGFQDFNGRITFQTHSLEDLSRWSLSEVAPVSEPGALALLALGLVGVVANRRRIAA